MHYIYILLKGKVFIPSDFSMSKLPLCLRGLVGQLLGLLMLDIESRLGLSDCYNEKNSTDVMKYMSN